MFIAAHAKGEFVFLTSDNRILYGHSMSSQLVEVSNKSLTAQLIFSPLIMSDFAVLCTLSFSSHEEVLNSQLSGVCVGLHTVWLYDDTTNLCPVVCMSNNIYIYKGITNIHAQPSCQVDVVIYCENAKTNNVSVLTSVCQDQF